MSSTKKTHRPRADSGAGSGTEGDWWEDVKNQKLDASRETANNKQKQQIDALKTEVSKLTNENSKLKTEKDKLATEAKANKIKSAEQKAYFEGLQNEIDTLKDGNKAKDKKIEALEKKLKELEDEKEELEEKIEELEDKNKKLTQENKDRSAAMDALQSGTFPPSPKSTESRPSRPTMSGALPANTSLPVRSKSKAGRTKKDETKDERRERRAREARREEEETQRRLRGRFEQRSSDDDEHSQGSNDRQGHRGSKHRPAASSDPVYAEQWGPATTGKPQQYDNVSYTPQSPTHYTTVPHTSTSVTRYPAGYDPNYAPPLTQVASLPPTNYYPQSSRRPR